MGQTVTGVVSYPFPLAVSPALHIIQKAATPPPECPGTAAAPAARPGHLCIYVGSANDAGAVQFYSVVDGDEEGPYTHGAAVYKESAADLSTYAAGTWAVTAP